MEDKKFDENAEHKPSISSKASKKREQQQNLELIQSYQQLIKEETNFLKNQELIDSMNRRYTDDEMAQGRDRLYTFEEEEVMRKSYA